MGTQFPRFWLLAGLLALAFPPAHGASEDIGRYTVHYVAVNSTFLNPDIASQYGIARGGRLGFINVSVLRNDPAGPTPVRADISGRKQNLLDQSEELEFVEVVEGDAVYYLGQFEFSNAEDLRFQLEIRPEGEGPTHPLEWTTKLYRDQ